MAVALGSPTDVAGTYFGRASSNTGASAARIDLSREHSLRDHTRRSAPGAKLGLAARQFPNANTE
jgi:hypothetical protein